MSNRVTYQCYRYSTIGKTLIDALDDLIARDAVTPQLSMKILAHFDAAIVDSLAECKSEAKLLIKGHLDTYRFCDDVWTFIVKDVALQFPQSHLDPVETDKLKIVAMISKGILDPRPSDRED